MESWFTKSRREIELKLGFVQCCRCPRGIIHPSSGDRGNLELRHYVETPMIIYTCLKPSPCPNCYPLQVTKTMVYLSCSCTQHVPNAILQKLVSASISNQFWAMYGWSWLFIKSWLVTNLDCQLSSQLSHDCYLVTRALDQVTNWLIQPSVWGVI